MDTTHQPSSSENSFNSVLAHIRKDSISDDGRINTRKLGDKFEQLIKKFFETDALYQKEYEGVWLWGNEGCPGRATTLRKLGGEHHHTDYGIDLVAKKHDGTLTAIQCKCYADDTQLQKKDVSEFISLGNSTNDNNKKIFDSMIFVWTGLEISKGAQLIIDNNPACRVLDRSVLNDSNIDWQSLLTKTPKRKTVFQPREHQEKAIEETIVGFGANNDRGKLIMACGTGKTFTTLRIAEKLVGEGGTILYLVPSISLLQQSMREWAEQATCRHRYVAVCSDTKVGRNNEDASLAELEIDPTTDPEKISKQLQNTKNSMTVVFSTYQSVKRVGEAQRLGNLTPFDLMICDEAHRTTGLVEAEQSDKDEKTGINALNNSENKISGFTYIHDNKNVNAVKRLYTTATPKIYTQSSRENLQDGYDNEVYSMDDDVYGKEFYKLKFNEAIGMGLLSDYKVIIITIEEENVSSIANKTAENPLLKLSSVAKWVGCWKGLVDPDHNGSGKTIIDGRDDTKQQHKEKRTQPLQRVIAFTQNIANSKRFAHSFEKVVNMVPTPFDATMKTEHVDGTQNSLNRRRKLDWLEDSHNARNECRILSNARCLSEGVDVPALDAVVFLNPRESIIDIIQAVGRVMRKASGKKYGYVILPVAIPAGSSDPNKLLDKSESFKVVWNVIRALRAHDSERFAKNIIDGNVLFDNIAWYQPEPCVDCAAGICERHTPRPACEMCESEFDGSAGPCPKHAISSVIDIPEHLIHTKIVDKISDRRYLENWAKDIAHIVHSTTSRINDLYQNNIQITKKIDSFHAGLKQIINETITHDVAISMLAQHMVMGRMFDVLFAEQNSNKNDKAFTKHNTISRAMDNVLTSLREYGLDAEMDKLEKFYKEIEGRVAGISTHGGRLTVIHELYDKFFNHAFQKEAKRLGVVYTPVEVIDFILKSTDYLMKENFGRGLTSKDVNIIDPFTGTGSFITRLMSKELNLIADKDLLYKYKNNLYANEIILMAYYIAAVNCESTFMERYGIYIPFEGITLTDTFHTKNLTDQWDEDLFTETQKRIEKQRNSKITLVVGNPPYSGGQKKYDDQNPNISYPIIRKKINDTYIAKLKTINSKIGSKNAMYDSYVHSIRWASDRIGNSGMIGFVTNGSFIRSEVGAGIRACMQEEFTDVWCFDLRGNTRIQGETSRKEGGTVFGSESRAPISITILVKNLNNVKKDGKGTIRYYDIGDYHTQKEKLDLIKNFGSIKGITNWQEIKPDKHHDWLDQRNKEFNKYLPIGSKDAKVGKGNSIFEFHSNGIKTHRDTWVYNSSKNELIKNMKTHIDYCCKHIEKEPNSVDTKQGKWDHELSKKLQQSERPVFSKAKIRTALYRPFFKQCLYFDKIFNTRRYQIPKFFPENSTEVRCHPPSTFGQRLSFQSKVSKNQSVSQHSNLCIIVPYKIQGKFSVFITDTTPDLEVIHHGQVFPIFTMENMKQENITNFSLKEYQNNYKDFNITKQDIFYYVYGMLHHPGYREKYANNLTRELPHIPMAPDFWAFSNTGKSLAALHLSWETCKRLAIPLVKHIPNSPKKLRWGSQTKNVEKNISGQNKKMLKIDGVVVYNNLPICDYHVNGRSPLEWFVDCYGYSTDQNSGITNWPLQNTSGEKIQELIERLAHVGMESDRLVAELPKEFEPKKSNSDSQIT